MARAFLLGTHAVNSHVQNLALALHELGLLGDWETGWVDLQSAAVEASAQAWLRRRVPAVHRLLARRRILPELEPFMRLNPGWEFARTASSRLGNFPLLTDWLHDRATFALERRCARQMRLPKYSGFAGVEYGALEALRAARQQGKVGMVAFLSPHHAFRTTWVDREYEKFPELLTPDVRRLEALGRERDRRRDAELLASDIVHAASQVTAESLVAAGVRRERLIVAPLGSPPPLSPDQLPRAPAKPMCVLYAGPVSVRKGAHHLLAAWRALAPGKHAELHFCGKNLLPESLLASLPGNVVLHGSLPQDEVFRRYRTSTILAFPSLCDGFGMVVSEALSQGLPVLTTANAGAAVMIEEGSNGFVVPAGDAQALRARLEWCLQNPAALHAMREPALRAAAHYTWHRYRATVRAHLSAMLANLNAP